MDAEPRRDGSPPRCLNIDETVPTAAEAVLRETIGKTPLEAILVSEEARSSRL